jgi:hypothetical protein
VHVEQEGLVEVEVEDEAVFGRVFRGLAGVWVEKEDLLGCVIRI